MTGSSAVEEIFLKNKWTPYLWIALIGLALYIKTVYFEATYLDDDILILNNFPFLGKLSNILQAFRQEVFKQCNFSFYRPILIASFIIDANIGRGSSLVFHLTNIFLHIAASSLLFMFLTKSNYRKDLALFFSILFTVHPVLVQAVAWIPGRNDSLLAVFSLASFISFVNYLNTDRLKWYAFHVLFFGLALFTKESAIGLAALFFGFLHLIWKEKFFSSREKKLALGWAATASFWFIMRHMAIKKPLDMSVFEVGANMIRNFPAFIQYAGKMMFPFNLSVFPIIQDTSSAYGIIAFCTLLLLFRHSKNVRYAHVLFGALWLAVFILPSFIRPVSDIEVNDFLEHRLYLPMMGFMIVLLETGPVNRIDFKRKKAAAAGALLIAIFSVTSFIHADNFKNELNFWKNAATTSPNAVTIVHPSLAAAYAARGMTDLAEKECGKAIALNPRVRGAHNVLGWIYMNKGMLDEAEAEFSKEIVLNSECSAPYLNMGIAQMKKGSAADAEAAWLKAVELDGDAADAIGCLAKLYYERMDFARAEYFARRLLELGVRIPEDVLETLDIK